MATAILLKNAHKMVSFIQKEKTIHKFDLMDKLSMSISTYNQMKPYVEHRYGHYVSYDRKSQTWTANIVTELTEGSSIIEPRS